MITSMCVQTLGGGAVSIKGSPDSSDDITSRHRRGEHH